MAKKIGSLYWEVGADTSKFETGLKGSKTQVSNFKQGLNDTVTGLTGFNVATLAGAGAVIAIGNAVKKSVVAWVDYNHQMDIGAKATGMQSTQYSRLVQAGDDVRVSQEAITTAMSLATKNGFQPSIENLADLADKLQGMSSATDRAALMSSIFGRGWKEINPLLAEGGTKFRELTASQADGLLVTDESIQQGNELYAMWDTLGDTATGLANTMSSKLFPALTLVGKGATTAASALELLLGWQDKINAVMSAHNEDIIKTSDGYKEYTQLFIQAALASGKMTKATYENIIAGREQMPLAQDFLHNLGMTTAFEYEAAKAKDATAAAIARQTVVLEGGTQGFIRYNEAQSNAVAMSERASQKNLDVAFSLSSVDEKAQYAANSIDNIKQQWIAGDSTWNEAMRKTQAVRDFLAGIYSKEVTIKINMETKGYSGKGGSQDDLVPDYSGNFNGGQGAGGGNTGAYRPNDPTPAHPGFQNAKGGSYLIPAGYGYEGANLGILGTASAGERVTITPANQFASGAIVFNFYGDPNANAKAAMRALKAQMGGAYQG